MSDSTYWGTNVPISMPQPLSANSPGVIDMDGFCFTANGIAHNLSPADWERLAIPTFAPQDPTQQTIRHDSALDQPGKTVS